MGVGVERRRNNYKGRRVGYPRGMYEKLGGKAGIGRLVDAFYRIMAEDPAAREVLATHAGRDLPESARKLKAFLSGWTGGPQEYLETYGHPRLRMRHSPFPITPVEARQWMECMEKALQEGALGTEERRELLGALAGVAQMLVNRG